ncbi:hypothetical protein B0O80DRAFT_451534 [Mortierella sp. GBAus27b]|nr:hypothetical protein BGX31_005964 [Mortierella sp. GBA43]KAI8353789.1 hypothetical protein B0O80DRAFT_451534 [Mortierella sp. GBAus27b]
MTHKPGLKHKLSDIVAAHAAARAMHNKTLQLPSVTLVATSAMRAARKACTAKVDAIIEECKSKNCKFRDSKFDLLSDRRNSLYSSLVSDTVYSDIAGTKRFPDIFPNDTPAFFLNGASPDDIKQGSVGDCWFVASLAVVSNIPDLIQQLCVKRDEEVGVYGFIFFKDGDWVSTVVDDQLFYKLDEQNKPRLYFSSCHVERESWLPLMEKAYAKIHGDYESLTGGYTGEGLEDLTGGTASMLFTCDILDKDRFWREEMQQVNKTTLMGCSINYDSHETEKNGIQSGHAYSVLRVAEFHGHRLVHIRNPWGAIEWTGDWSDGSERWKNEADAIKTLQQEDKDDGRFWMPYLDFLRIFTTIDRCRVFDASWSVASSWIPYNVEPRSNGRFKFQLSQEDDVVIALSQPDTRYYGAFTTEFINTLAFHVYDVNNKLIRRAKTTVPYSKRSVTCELRLKAGEYTVIPHVEREPTDVVPETGETRADNAVSPATQKDDVQVMVESVQMDKSSYMFKQRKAGLVRSMSMARITGRTLLGVDEEDYENGGQPKSLEEEHWQLMLGLRVYSHDQSITVTGSRGVHPTQRCTKTSHNLDSHEKEDPESVTATLADKKEPTPEPTTPSSEKTPTKAMRMLFRQAIRED